MTLAAWGQQPRREAGEGPVGMATAAPGACPPPGVYKEPSLSAQPGALVPSGHSLTLQCRSEAGFDRFALTKEGLPTPQPLGGQPSPDFPLGQANGTHGGRYRCYGAHNVSHAWSAPSAPLDVLVTGEVPSLPGSCLLRRWAPGGPGGDGGQGRILEQRLRWARGPRGGSEKGAPRGSETETPPQRLRAAERGQSFCREDGDPQLRVHGVWGGAALYTPSPSPPQECPRNPPSRSSRGPLCPGERL